MRGFYVRYIVVFGVILFAAGCGGGGTIELARSSCTEDVDCFASEGFTCEHKDANGWGICDKKVQVIECPSDRDAGGDAGDDVDAGETPDAGETADGGVDAGETNDAGVLDAGRVDAGELVDAGVTPDAGEIDAGATPDAGDPVDAGTPVDGGSNSVDAGEVDAGPNPTALTIDHEQWRKISNDVVFFTWNTNHLATSELFIGGGVVESNLTPKFNHALAHQFALGTQSFQMVSNDGIESLAVGGVITIEALPDVIPPVIVIGSELVTSTSAVIKVLYVSEPLFDRTLTCAAEGGQMTVRPSGAVGSNAIPLSGLSPGTSYACQMTGSDTASAHNQSASEITQFTTAPAAVSVIPFIVAYAEQEAVDGTMLKWRAGKELASPVTIEYWTGSGAHITLPSQPGGMSGSVVVTGLPSGVTFSFSVTGNSLAGVTGSDSGIFTTLPIPPLTFGATTVLPVATHPSTSIDLLWWSNVPAKTVQVKCGTLPPVNVTGLPATSGKVALTGLNPITAYPCQVVATDQFGSVSTINVPFTTWYVETGKVVFMCDQSITVGCSVKVYWQSADFSTNGAEVQLVDYDACAGQLVSNNPPQKIQIASTAQTGGAIQYSGQAVRVYRPDGSPVLYNGLPVLPIHTQSNYFGRAVLNTDVLRCRAFGN